MLSNVGFRAFANVRMGEKKYALNISVLVEQQPIERDIVERLCLCLSDVDSHVCRICVGLDCESRRCRRSFNALRHTARHVQRPV